jgi:hypothetical protein
MASEPAVTFLFTNTHDVTADLLVSKIGTERIFRFNFNQWQDYSLVLTASGFEIENPAGRKVTAPEVAKFYWRKPMRWKHLTPELAVSDRVNYIEEELWYMMRELVNLLWLRDRLVLVEPFADMRCGKLVQAQAASRYFNVPPFKCVFGSPRSLERGRRSVVKSLSSTRIDKRSVFYTTAVQESDLDPSVPWMIQDLIVADADVTIAFVRDRLFSFSLARRPFVERTLDWREVATEYVTDEWLAHPLPPEIERGVFALMGDLRLQYGRIDMLLAEGVYHFLEVNPNGEWGWLDASGAHGLLDKIIAEISPDTPRYPIPVSRSIGAPEI